MNIKTAIEYIRNTIREILLLVIGILIAIYLNNLNQEYKNGIKERKILQNILIDLKSNNKLIEAAEAEITTEIVHTNHIINIMEKAPSDSSLNAIDSLIYYGTEVATLELKLAKIYSLIDHDFVLIKDDSLKQQITLYIVAFDKYKTMEKRLRKITDFRIRPKIKEYVYLNELLSGATNFRSDRKGLLSDRTLANDFIDRSWESNDWLKNLQQLKQSENKLIGIIENYMGK